MRIGGFLVKTFGHTLLCVTCQTEFFFECNLEVNCVVLKPFHSSMSSRDEARFMFYHYASTLYKPHD